MNDALASVVLDLATREQPPSAWEANQALRAVSPVVRVYELMDKQLHVCDRRDSPVAWTPLAAFAERVMG